MKKLLLPVLALFTLGAQAQYTPSGASLPNGTLGQSYSQTVNVAIPANTSVSGSAVSGLLTAAVPALAPFAGALGALSIPLAVSSTVLTVSGSPAGISAVCTPASCSFAGAASGTIAFSGTPTAGGSFTVNIGSSTTGTLDLAALASLSPIPIPGLPASFDLPQAIPGIFDKTYTLFVNDPNGIEELDVNTFSTIGAYPNPTTGQFSFGVSSPKGADVNISLVDLSGRVVYNNNHKTQTGVNVIRFDLGLADGVYGYTITQGNDVLRGKFSVVK